MEILQTTVLFIFVVIFGLVALCLLVFALFVVILGVMILQEMVWDIIRSCWGLGVVQFRRLLERAQLRFSRCPYCSRRGTLEVRYFYTHAHINPIMLREVRVVRCCGCPNHFIHRFRLDGPLKQGKPLGRMPESVFVVRKAVKSA